MKKYVYTVSKITTAEDEQRVINIVRSCVDAEGIEASLKTSSICFFVDSSVSQDDMERKLSYALMSSGYELILPEGVGSFVPAKEPRQIKIRSVSLSTAIILAVSVGLFCVMMTFGICTRYLTSQNQQTSETVGDIAALDEFFRTYSYDGITDEKFAEHMLDAYIHYSGDKYAEYYTEEELEALERKLTGQFVGIGVQIKSNEIDLGSQTFVAIEIVSVYENSPAQESGMKVGDKITHIKSGSSMVSVTEIGYEAARELMAGEEGSFVEFRYYRADDSGEYKAHEIKMERRKVTTISVKGEICETDAKVGIIRISNFDYTTPVQFCEAVDSLTKQGCTDFVIDLRGNPGGYVESVAAVLSYFLDEGDLIMTAEDRDGRVAEKQTASVRENEYFSVKKSDIGKYKGMKMSVLVGGDTASAAELFTATVKDYSLGTVVGVKTYGKGCMQKTYLLKEYGLEGALKLTTHMYYSKSHTSYHGEGIVPDITVELSDKAQSYAGAPIPHDEDNQLQRAIRNMK